MNVDLELRKILSSILQVDPEAIDLGQDMSSYGRIDSLSYVRLIVEIEDRIGVSIGIVDLLDSESIGNLYELILKEKEG